MLKQQINPQKKSFKIEETKVQRYVINEITAHII